MLFVSCVVMSHSETPLRAWNLHVLTTYVENNNAVNTPWIHIVTRFQRQQEANIKTLSAAKTSTENEIEELAARIKELDTLSKIEDEETAIADAARRATLAVCV